VPERGHDPDVARLKKSAGMMPTFALPATARPGSWGRSAARRRALEVRVDAQLVVGRDALGDAMIVGIPASAASRTESAAKRAGTNTIAVFAPVFLDRPRGTC
jgi:hypothetical protein